MRRGLAALLLAAMTAGCSLGERWDHQAIKKDEAAPARYPWSRGRAGVEAALAGARALPVGSEPDEAVKKLGRPNDVIPRPRPFWLNPWEERPGFALVYHLTRCERLPNVFSHALTLHYSAAGKLRRVEGLDRPVPMRKSGVASRDAVGQILAACDCLNKPCGPARR